MQVAYDFSLNIQDFVITPQQLGYRPEAPARDRILHIVNPLALSMQETMDELKEIYPIFMAIKLVGPMSGNYPAVNRLFREHYNQILIVPMKRNEHTPVPAEIGYRFTTERSRNTSTLRVGCITIDLTAPSVLIGFNASRAQ